MKCYKAVIALLTLTAVTPVHAEKFEWLHRNFRLNYWIDVESIKRDGELASATVKSEGVCEKPVNGNDFSKTWKRYVGSWEFDCNIGKSREMAARYLAVDGTLAREITSPQIAASIPNGAIAAAAAKACDLPIQSPVADLRKTNLMPFNTGCVVWGRAVESGRTVREWYVDTKRITKDGGYVFVWTRDVSEQTLSWQGKDFVTNDQKLAVRCAQQELAVVEEFLFDADNRQVHTARMPTSTWKFQSARPGTSQATLIDLACGVLKVRSSTSPDAGTPRPSVVPGVAGAGTIPAYESVKSTGTGFFVNGTHVVSNAHVVDECSAVAVKYGEVIRLGEIAARDNGLDTTVIRVLGVANVRPISLSAARTEELGQDILVMGYPLSGLLSQGVKVTNGVVSALSGLGDDKRMMQISAAVQPGNSGGPVLDGQGRVIGVVRAKLRKELGGENVNFAVRGAALRSFLDLNDIAYEAALGTGNKLSTADVAKIGEKATALVLCY